MSKQIDALKLALEALDMVKTNADDWQERTGKEIKGWMQPVNNSITAIKEALAQPEQEPVPDLYVKDINGNFHSYKEKGHTVSSQCVPPSHVGVGEDDFTPQRKPLTDDEAFKLIEQDYQMEEYAQAALQLIRRTEAAHNIKE